MPHDSTKLTMLREWATPAALLGVVALLFQINGNIDRNCDAIAQTNAQIRFVLAVQAEKADGPTAKALRQQSQTFREPNC